jgi:hypothetical protein
MSLTLDPSEISAPIMRSISALRRLDSQAVGNVRSGGNAGGDLPVFWRESKFEASSMSNESLLSVSLTLTILMTDRRML